jgi:hypothetical protein
VPVEVAPPTLSIRMMARPGVGEGHRTVEAGKCRRREGPLLLVRLGRSDGTVIDESL